MKHEPTYHIDVTPEEELLFKDENLIKENISAEPKKYSKAAFVKMFGVVLGVHMVIVAAIGYNSISAHAANLADDKKFVGETSQTANATTSQQPTPVPTPTPTTPESKTSVADWPKSSAPVVTKPPIKQKEVAKKPPVSSQKYTTQYVVKQGDTLNSIAKRFKLNMNRLVKINNIKDPAKIKVGQTLKFM